MECSPALRWSTRWMQPLCRATATGLQRPTPGRTRAQRPAPRSGRTAAGQIQRVCHKKRGANKENTASVRAAVSHYSSCGRHCETQCCVQPLGGVLLSPGELSSHSFQSLTFVPPSRSKLKDKVGRHILGSESCSAGTTEF